MDSNSNLSDMLLSCSSMLLQPFRALLDCFSFSVSSQGDTFSSMDSNCTQNYRYDVFISFRGPDTRNSFVDHLYAHLTKKGLFVFKDDKRLEKGQSLSTQLLQAIENSRTSIVVFSENYVKSTWCLEEMVAISKCIDKYQRKVFPVFYDIDPSDVRKQGGVYQNDFFLRERQFKHDLGKVVRWRRAMVRLTALVGWDVRCMPEFEVIENIVQEVIKTLGYKSSGFDDLVGIEPHVEALEFLLKLDSKNDEFRVIGVWGMGGIGKTTLTTILYDRISCGFGACCFIENVSKIYRDGGAIAIQKQILCQAFDEKNLESYSPSEVSGILRNRLSNINVLVVLDNVEGLKQVQELAIDSKFLHAGSRMIITTRDVHILKVFGAHEVYEVPLLNSNDAHELFCKKVFQNEGQSSNCVELIPEVLGYAQHLPLAIKVVGSFLCTRDATQWRDALDRLRNNPHNDVMDVLQMSVDELQHEEKEIFIHIACFFKGEREDYVKRILDACGLHPHIGIQRILEKSLITIKNEEIHMHDMLQELGKKIVRHGFLEEPGFWSRLWRYNDFYHVLMTETGTNNVRAIVLDQKENVSKCRAEGFSNMRNLALLILYHNNFSGNLSFLSNNLRYLLWHGYPFTSLPSNFEPYYLVELNMPDSSIQRLWEGCKEFPSLKRMDLSNSKKFRETPEFSRNSILERLDFTGCTNLIQVHSSIGHLTKLAFLSLQNCSSLVNLDFGSVSNLSSLRVLRLCGCTKLEKTPNFTGTSKLEYLDMERCTSLSIVHESIGVLKYLTFLSLRGCTNLVEISNNINRMISLRTLDLCGCSKLKTLPLGQTFHDSHLESLISLDLSFCDLHEVPAAIGELKCLERLNLQGNSFDSLPYEINPLESLAYLNLSHCHNLQTVNCLPTKSDSSGESDSSGSRHDYRSGVYFFDCPKLFRHLGNQFLERYYTWLQVQYKYPRCIPGSCDIVVPWDSNDTPPWFKYRFDGDSIVRIVTTEGEENVWFGFVFCVVFENGPANSVSLQDSFTSALPHPFYLSFESEHTEERFDMPLSLKLDKVDGSKHLWLIYISRFHCHFAKTGAHITFKACPSLIIKKWGLQKLIMTEYRLPLLLLDTSSSHDILNWFTYGDPHTIFFDRVQESSSRSGPKIQLPYNWSVINKEEIENSQTKSKEIELYNLGL